MIKETQNNNSNDKKDTTHTKEESKEQLKLDPKDQKIKELSETIEKNNVKVKDITETLQRLQAEFENYRKRIEKETIENIKYANKNLIMKILPTLDNLDLAFKYKNNQEEFNKGIELVKQQLIQTLEKEGVKEIESKGKLNPLLHEPLLTEESKEPKETILEELQKGYTLNNKVIRQAKVKISK